MEIITKGGEGKYQRFGLNFGTEYQPQTLLPDDLGMRLNN